ncbi:YdbH domain-containing protein [Erythrobacter sp.]|uniref:intermembrane phospholipid transport protein YdbH family protein n=1 Tax=Erythrobacter sp. TaxID=1042 RepID=UPI002605EE23|nr:YdbH domain-containing protein [Erythrobacter sp.]
MALIVLLLIVGSTLWFSRERIATDLIDDYISQTGLEATYDLVSIGAKRQVIANVLVGDPSAPDLTIERVTVDLSYGFGTPEVGFVKLERPKLFGTLIDGTLSFGALDPIVFGESAEPFAGLPEIAIDIVEGGARLDTDYGRIGLALEGEGPLDNGFAGTLAVVAPDFGIDECATRSATAYGTLTTKAGSPRFEGPLRLRRLKCEGAELASVDVGAVLSADREFARVDGEFDLSTGAIEYSGNRARSVSGRAGLSAGWDDLILDHDLTIEAIDTPYVTLASLRADGVLRSARGFTESSWNADLQGAEVLVAPAASGAIAEARRAASDTLVAPLLGRFERGLSEAMGGNVLNADVVGRIGPRSASVVVPTARLRSSNGDVLLALSRVSWSASGEETSTRLSGNILTGGQDLPQITGRFEQDAGAPLSMRLSMAPYSAGADSLELSRLNLRELPQGGFAFAGRAQVSGAIPGGAVRNLSLPLNGRFEPAAGLSVGAQCETVRFAQIRYADLSLDKQTLRLCPEKARAMLTYDEALEIAVQANNVRVVGALSDSPTRFEAQNARLRYPGGFELMQASATIGEPDNALRLSSARFTGALEAETSGEFSGAAAGLDVVPLDVSDLAGQWSFNDGVLSVSKASFTLTDRVEGLARFNPLSSEDATLTLDGSEVTALARLSHKASGAPVTSVAIAHSLASSEGSALLEVDALKFDDSFAMSDLTPLAEGVVAYTNGTVAGEGRIAWAGEDIRSTGAFRSDSLDLAAAFGPVTGMKGEVRFSDLLSMTTEPSQVIEIESINPGLEVLAGKVRFSLTDGEIIDVEDARWPFMGGSLIMRPTTLRYGTDSEQRYTFEIVALDAAKFVTQMELSNLGATGIFDGLVPVVFDAQGNGRIEGGELASRPPGGNVSYIGELTYEDMGTISNFAFQSLRSLDYRHMGVDLEGDLAGEIITRFRIDGVRQGADASQNFITRRLSRLPIRFNVNVRSENFYELATMVRTFWDPTSLPDAPLDEIKRGDPSRPMRDVPAPPSETDGVDTDVLRPDEPRVQPPESETLP